MPTMGRSFCPGFMILTIKNVHLICATFCTNIGISGKVNLERKIFKQFYYVKFKTPPRAPVFVRGHELYMHNIESSLYKQAFEKILAFHAKWFLRSRFLNIYSFYLYVRL